LLSYLCIRSFRKLGAFAIGVFFDSSDPSCGRRYRPRTTMPHPTLPRTLGFRWGLPCLLSTPLCIHQEISRVHHEGLKRNAVGGVLLNAPSPLWGSPIFLQGRVRLTWSPITDHPMQSSLVLTLHKKAFQARRADIISKVCQGPLFP